jgi:hypothetical protein
LDLDTGWDFTRADHRREAKQLLDEQQPRLVVLSPKRSPFSCMQNLSKGKRDPIKVAAELEEGDQHLKFCVEIAMQQHRAGRGVLFEQPWSATSWQRAVLASLIQTTGVMIVRTDLCMHGLRVTDSLGDGGWTSEEFNKKPTGLMTNVPEIAETVQKKCDKMHRHGLLVGGGATRRAQVCLRTGLCEVYLARAEESHQEARSHDRSRGEEPLDAGGNSGMPCGRFHGRRGCR